MNKKLLLFDIDGTLIHSNGAGRETLVATLTELFGTAGPVENYAMDGKTDPRIISDLLTAANVPAAEIEAAMPHIFERMKAKAHAIFPHRQMTPCPGVPALLAHLQQCQDVVLGLLTGNGVLTAPLKLHYAGIDPALFVVGAYGSDHIDRNQLPAIAMQRAAALIGFAFDGSHTIVIGDTPADILCARAGRATAVAVATGWHSAASLAKYHPDYLLENLADTVEVLRILCHP